MSTPDPGNDPADRIILKRLELLDDAITFELHSHMCGVGVLTLGFREHNPHRYRLTRIGYDLVIDEGDVAMFSFTGENKQGATFAWYAWTENPAQIFTDIHAHIAAIKARVAAENS